MEVKVCPKCGKHNSNIAWKCINCGEMLSVKTLMDTDSGQLLSEIEDNEKEISNLGTNTVTPFYGMKIGMFGAFVAAIPVSILKTIMAFSSGSSCTTYVNLGSIELTSCGLISYPYDFMCWLYLGFALLGGALFGALGAYIGRNFFSYSKEERKQIFWWSFASGILFDLFFVFYFLWPGF